MINPRRFHPSLPVKYGRSPTAGTIYWSIVRGILAFIVLMVINGFAPGMDVAAQEIDPGETNPIKPSARLTLFPDQHALLAMPQNPDTDQAPSTYTDWSRSSDLQSLEFQEAFVPDLQNLERVRAASGHILNQMNAQVAVGWYKGSPQTRVNNTIVVDILTPALRTDAA